MRRMIRSLRDFRGDGYSKGRGLLWQVAWVAVSSLLFQRTFFPPAARPTLLRMFGASVGEGVRIRGHVRIHWPWKLHIGDHSWVGVGAWLLNLEEIEIGSNVCISQDAFLCTGSHDQTSPTFEFDNAPINVEDHVWIAARATLLRGVRVGKGAVVGAAALVARDVPAGARVYAPRSIVVEDVANL